ncbi:purple acid phosphatase family protein [Actinomadura rudentiformis]|uniref:Metallophosphoesterase family protein n=1 Tax=Actinomadura rudentiformis TaxID=359158 RepID=A0A6H9Z457_9ACTN|nr:metallophosphoesterase family protein [Actinomadura rudentiformis]KAB2348302.1 metallophosphoesterase family protein [Actinomadura rudentiformis]
MICCRPSRRELLRWSVVVAGASLLPVTDPERVYAAAARSGAARSGMARAVDLELVTLTETSAILTWYTGVPGTDDGLGRMKPAPADSEVEYGTHPGRLTQRATGPANTPYHYVEITGLEPGRTYYYRARSQGKAASATPLAFGQAAGTPHAYGVFSFTTPQPPPGSFLFSVALCNDLHVGETVAGLVGQLPWIKGIEQVPGHPPYPEIMAKALVEDARRRGASYLLAAGDVTSEAVPVDVGRARTLLDGFGSYGRDYLVARGNHDRAHEGAAHASCSPGQWQGRDCFRDGFFVEGPTYFTNDLHGLRVIGLDTYDKPGNGGDSGGLGKEQYAWLESRLKDNPDQPTIVFGHHPLFVENAPLAITGGQSIEAGQAISILRAYDRAPGVFLHHAGHTHRNQRSVFPLAPRVVQQEVAAVKEYPGGFTLLRVHTGGYALNFYKTRGDLARAWSERSRQELSGLWPQLSLGNRVTDRNSVTHGDLSGISRPQSH